MTPEEAAHAAADRHDTTDGFVELPYDRDLYVRAFLAGAQWQQTRESPLNKLTYGIVTSSPSAAHVAWTFQHLDQGHTVTKGNLYDQCSCGASYWPDKTEAPPDPPDAPHAD